MGTFWVIHDEFFILMWRKKGLFGIMLLAIGCFNLVLALFGKKNWALFVPPVPNFMPEEFPPPKKKREIIQVPYNSLFF